MKVTKGHWSLVFLQQCLCLLLLLIFSFSLILEVLRQLIITVLENIMLCRLQTKRLREFECSLYFLVD